MTLQEFTTDIIADWKETLRLKDEIKDAESERASEFLKMKPNIDKVNNITNYIAERIDKINYIVIKHGLYD